MRFALSWRAAAAGPELPELPPQPKRATAGGLPASRVHDGCYRLFHIAAIPVHVHWSVFMMFAAVAVASVRLGLGLLWGALAVCIVMLAHELGHAMFARRLGYEVSEIRLYPFRGHCRYDEPYSDFEVAAIAWGGIAGQLLLLLPAAAMLYFYGNTASGALNVFLIVFSCLNAAIIAINLIPARNLDGANAWRLPLMLFRARRTMRALMRSHILF
jgi:stage IV sporulation protein FB